MKKDSIIRSGENFDVRSGRKGIKVSGYAAVFDEDADIGGYFIERIERGAFADAIGRDDVVFVINHEGLPLARNTAGKGTLTLKEDDHGLYIETYLNPDDPDVKTIVPKMERGDLDKMSFRFGMTGGIQEWDETVEPNIRTIKKVGDLQDVAIVTSPAYAGTDIGLRCLEAYQKEKRSQNHHSAARRISNKIDLDLRERVGR